MGAKELVNFENKKSNFVGELYLGGLQLSYVFSVK